MTFSDLEKLKRLDTTFKLNFRISNLYAEYLERYPELITAEMVAELCDGTDITRAEAVGAILCEAFLLDGERGAEDRRLIRDYVLPSVRILDAKRYTADAYYKNIALRAIASEGVRHGKWELKWEYYPPYRAAVCDDMVICEDFTEYAPIGFFTEGFRFPAVLEDGNEWMTLTPVDTDTCQEAIAAARGKVVTFGLGLGYYAYMASEKREVESVTVVERSEDVIKLFRELILPYFPNKEKITIVKSDAFEYAQRVMPGEDFDYAFVDTWRDASDGAPMYERMRALEKLSPRTEFAYWIESFLISRVRAVRYRELSALCEAGDEGAPRSYAEFIERLTK